MGCASSRVDKDERVRVCKERKRVMKHLVGFRAEFANAILAYLRALKNTGVTLRQFTESESLELEGILPPSPPLPLPPSPPLPPPIESPDLRKLKGKQHVEEAQEEIIEIGEDSSCTPPPPPDSAWDFRDLLDMSSVQHEAEVVTAEGVDEENWAETRSQFEEDNPEHITSDKPPDAPKRYSNLDVVNDDSLMLSRHTRDTVNMAMVVWRRKKTLAGIIKELDDYFLKASAGGKEISVLVDMGTRNISLHHDFRDDKGKGNSARVLSSLSFNWSSRSLQLTKGVQEVSIPTVPCEAGAHCITLEKLYAEEQKLHKAVREEEMVKLEHKRKSTSLRKQEDENTDLNKIEKYQCAVESLQADILRLQDLVRRTCSSILSLINEELHPQLVALISGLIHMWKIMYECHQVQTDISQQVHHLTSHHHAEPTTNYHREATVQLESEVNFWYNSFCRVTKCQRQYVTALCSWIQLTDCLVDGENRSHCTSMVHALCDRWQLSLDRLPEKDVSEAIKSFLLVIRSIILQQEEECSLKKKTDRLERKLHKEINTVIEMEKKLEASFDSGEGESGFGLNHPLSTKRAKVEALRNRYENEKAKYVSSIQATRAMTLNNLQKSLPHVFEALMEFSSSCAKAFESALNHAQQVSNVEQSHVEE